MGQTDSRTLKIQHALNGEHPVPGTRYILEEYDEKTKTAYEYHDACVCVFPLKQLFSFLT